MHACLQMCPAMFRWYAADMQHSEVFRLTPKTVLLGLVLPVIPILIYGYFIQNKRVCQAPGQH